MKFSRTRTSALRAAATIGALALIVAGCSSGSEDTPEPTTPETTEPEAPEESPSEDPGPRWTEVPDAPVDVRFSLAFTPSGYEAPYALAQVKGWFEEAGLKVSIAGGPGSSAAITALAGGQLDISVPDLGTLVINKEASMPIEAIGVIFPSTPTAVAVHADSGVEDVSDLAGKTIAVTTGGFDAQLLPAFLESNGLEGQVEAVNVSSSAKTGAFLARQVDGFVPLLCGTGVVVEKQEGAALKAFPFGDYGVHTMGFGVVANTAFTDAHPEATRAFLEVIAEAWAYSAEHPDEAAAAMVEVFPETNAETIQAQLECSLDFVPDGGSSMFTSMFEDQWQQMVETLQKYAGVDPLPMEDYYTTEFELQ